MFSEISITCLLCTACNINKSYYVFIHLPIPPATIEWKGWVFENVMYTHNKLSFGFGLTMTLRSTFPNCQLPFDLFWKWLDTCLCYLPSYLYVEQLCIMLQIETQLSFSGSDPEESCGFWRKSGAQWRTMLPDQGRQETNRTKHPSTATFSRLIRSRTSSSLPSWWAAHQRLKH